MAIKKKSVVKKKVASKKKVAPKKKVISRKSPVKKKVAVKKKAVAKKSSPSIELTKAHQKAIAVQERSESSLSKAKDSLSAAMEKSKSAKTTTAKNNAKNRVTNWRTKIAEINGQVKSAKSDVSVHEKIAKDLLTMNSAREKAVSTFIKKWDAAYKKKQIQKKRDIAARNKAAAKKRKEQAKSGSNKPVSSDSAPENS